MLRTDFLRSFLAPLFTICEVSNVGRRITSKLVTRNNATLWCSSSIRCLIFLRKRETALYKRALIWDLDVSAFEMSLSRYVQSRWIREKSPEANQPQDSSAKKVRKERMPGSRATIRPWFSAAYCCPGTEILK